jgi:pimeloyl-ACP methyl ester carboxylesterase
MREYQPIEIRMADGQWIRGDCHLTPSSQPVPVVVFAHGLGSDCRGEKVSAFEAECARRGWALVAADFRGHGRSDGRMIELSGPRLLEDLAAVVTEARRRAGGPLLLAGSSLGGWAAAWLTLAKPALTGLVDACALIAPALRFFEWLRLSDSERTAWALTGRYHLRTPYLDLELGAQLLSDATLYPYDTLLERFSHPTVLFHGMGDETIPYQLSLDFVERSTETRIDLFLSREGDHRLISRKDIMARESCELLARLAV